MDKIIDLMHLGIDVSFSKDVFGTFDIKLSHKDQETGLINTTGVHLPFNHLNEDKINKYLDHLSTSLLEKVNYDYRRNKLHSK